MYPHDITGKAVNGLIKEGFLLSEHYSFGNNMHAIFIWRHNVRYVARDIKLKASIMEKFSADELNDGAGKYAESLFLHMVQKNQFNILDRDANMLGEARWTFSDKNLDFIIEKDGLRYGVEIKNTFDYMPQAEFEEKIKMCKFLGLIPLFPLRFSSPLQHQLMKVEGGLALIFKSRIFPPGNQKLVTEIWNHFRLPVTIWESIQPHVENNFLSFHQRSLIRCGNRQ
jgi:hypothetical protein